MLTSRCALFRLRPWWTLILLLVVLDLLSISSRTSSLGCWWVIQCYMISVAVFFRWKQLCVYLVCCRLSRPTYSLHLGTKQLTNEIACSGFEYSIFISRVKCLAQSAPLTYFNRLVSCFSLFYFSCWNLFFFFFSVDKNRLLAGQNNSSIEIEAI